MSINLIQSASYLIGIIISIGIIIFALGYFRSQSNKANTSAQQNLNVTLNELLSARDKKIADLEETVKEQGHQIAMLMSQVEILQTQKSDMEILIKTALKEHFASHPAIALELQGKIKA